MQKKNRLWTGHPAVSFLFLLIVTFFPAFSIAQSVETWQAHRNDKTAPVPSIVLNHHRYFQVAPLVAALGGELIPVTSDRQIVRLDIHRHRILINAEQKVFSIDGKTHFLDHPTRLIAGRLWVPSEWLEKVTRTLYGQPPVLRANHKDIFFNTQNLIPVRVEVQTQATLTRILFISATPVVYQLTRRANGLHIRVNRQLATLEGPGLLYRDTRLNGIREVPDAEGYPALMLLFDPARFRYRAYSLENPFRFIVEIFEPHNAPAPSPATPTPSQPPSSSSPTPPRAANPREFDVIVIDPGHGGAETGTIGPNGTREKDITLAIARRLKRILEARLGLKVFLTRDDDRAVSLDERAARANEYHADLFISIHANSALRGRARGAETYYLSVDWLDEESRKRLNKAEPGAFQSGSRSGDVLDLILWDMAQTAYIEESSRFARLIQHTLNQELGLSNRGVKQAPFRVLMGARMPAVLIEVGFLDNPDEEKRLRDPSYQERLALAIYRSIERYMRSIRSLYSPLTTSPAENTGREGTPHL